MVYLLNYMLEVRRATSDKEEEVSMDGAGGVLSSGGVCVCCFGTRNPGTPCFIPGSIFFHVFLRRGLPKCSIIILYATIGC